MVLATLIAHGTNLGISAMGYSAAGITVDMLRQASQWFFNAENLRAANTILVDYHYHLAAGYTEAGARGLTLLLQRAALPAPPKLRTGRVLSPLLRLLRSVVENV